MSMSTRMYKTGMNWAFWRWSASDSKHLDRLHILKTPWFAVCLHWLNAPDPEPYLHDHPVTFLSIILRGGYAEHRHDRLQLFASRQIHRWYNFVRATDQHRIVEVEPGTLTLALMGPKVREWGYHTESGWRYWKDYFAEQRGKRRKEGLE